MINQPTSLKESFSQQTILYYALVAGVIMMGLVAFIINEVVGLNFDMGLPPELLYVGGGYVVFTFFISNYVFKQMMSKVDSTMNLGEKVEKYRSASIIKYAIVEGAALIIGIGYLVTGNYQYFILFGVAVGYFLFVRPTKQEMIDGLNLSYREQQELGFE